jgi:hypothetical protein
MTWLQNHIADSAERTAFASILAQIAEIDATLPALFQRAFEGDEAGFVALSFRLREIGRDDLADWVDRLIAERYPERLRSLLPPGN